jgi:hypothetical protein
LNDPGDQTFGAEEAIEAFGPRWMLSVIASVVLYVMFRRRGWI